MFFFSLDVEFYLVHNIKNGKPVYETELSLPETEDGEEVIPETISHENMNQDGEEVLPETISPERLKSDNEHLTETISSDNEEADIFLSSPQDPR